jgi:hypothetical protein
MRRKATPAELWASYQELGTLRAVAERHGYAAHTSVRYLLCKAGYALHPTGYKASDRDIIPIEEAQATYAEAGSYAEAARRLSTTPNALRIRLVRARQRGQA